MNGDEISRILSLLEEGKIDAAEAERLLGALGAAPKQSPEPDPLVSDPFRDASEVFGRVGQAFRKWLGTAPRCRVRVVRGVADPSKPERALTQSTLKRLWWVAYGNGLTARSSFSSELRMDEDLHWDDDEVDWIVSLIEDEFNVEGLYENYEGCNTLGDLIERIEEAIRKDAEPEEFNATSSDPSEEDAGVTPDQETETPAEPEEAKPVRKAKSGT